MRVSPREAKRRSNARAARRKMQQSLYAAFGDLAMLEHSALVVWTRGQMNGVRVMIKRLGLGCSA
jgi:hypothetical protein